MLTLLQRVRDKALSAISGVNQFVQNNPRPIDAIPEVVNSLPQFIQQAPNKTLLPIAEQAGATIGKTLQQIPTLPNIVGVTSMPNMGIESLKSYGKTLERFSDPVQRQQIPSNFSNLIGQVRSGDIMGAWNNPVVEDALNAADFIPFGMFAGMTDNVLRSGLKRVNQGQNILDAEKAVRSGKYAKVPEFVKLVEDNIKSATSGKQAGNIITELISPYLEMGDPNILSSLRAALNHQLSSGEKTLRGKKRAFAEMMNNPELVDFSNSVLENVRLIDERLKSNIPAWQPPPPPVKFPELNRGENAIKTGKKTNFISMPDGTLVESPKGIKSTNSLDNLIVKVQELLQGSKPTEPTRKFIAGENGQLRLDQKMLPEPKKPAGLLPAPQPQKTSTMFTPPQPDIPELPRLEKKSGLRKMTEHLFGDKNIEGSKGVIKNLGPEGEQIVSTLNAKDEFVAIKGGENRTRMEEALRSLSKQEKDTFVDVVEGKINPISEKQAFAVDTWKKIAEQIYQDATSSNIKVGKRENYFPRFTKKDFNGSFDPIKESQDVIFGNLEKSRTTDTNFIKDPEVLLNYIDKAYDRIGRVRYFGQSDQNLYSLVDQIGARGGDSDQARLYLNQILGKEQPSNWSKPITDAQIVRKFNVGTAITNLTQNLSTMMRTDQKTMAIALKNFLTDYDGSVKNAKLVSELGKGMGSVLDEQIGSGSVVSKWLHLIGMTGAEGFNRVVAVNAGMEYAKKLGKQLLDNPKNGAAIRELERIGIKAEDVLKNGVTDEMLKKAGRNISQQTQFLVKAGDVPYAWRTNMGKIATQFKSFSYKQTGFIKNEAKRYAQELRNGNPKPLLNALVTAGVAAPIVGEINQNLRSIIFNKERQDTNTLGERYISNILSAVSFGLLDSTGGIFGKYGAGGIVGTLVGPSASDAYNLAGVVSETKKGLDNYDLEKTVTENLDPSGSSKRFLLKQIPGIGNTLSNTLVPNSYIDNKNIAGVNIGVNEGLNKEDKEQYQSMKTINPAGAESFKKENQAINKPKENIISNLFAPKEKWTEPKTKEEKKKEKKAYEKLLDRGATDNIPDRVIITHEFNGKKYEDSSSTEKKQILDKLVKYQNDTEFDKDYLNRLVNVSGVSKRDYDYYSMASKPEDERAEMFLSVASQDYPDRNNLLLLLALNKQKVSGKQNLSTGIVDYLYDNGRLTKKEKALLQAVKFDPVFNKFYMDRDYKGNSPSKSEINKIASAVNKTYKTVSNIKVNIPNAPSAPKLLLSPKSSRKKKRSNILFKPY